MKKISSITKEELIKFGMVESDDPVHPMKKIISIQGDNEDDEEGEISLAITRMRNVPELCLHLPDGATVYLAISSIKQLKDFEKCIGSWEPSY